MGCGWDGWGWIRVQAVMNHRRQSTDGWSVGNIQLDLTGALASFAQMATQAADQSSLSVFQGDVGKIGLSLETLVFDLLFVWQHYVLFSGNEPPQRYSKLDTLDAFDLDGDDNGCDTPSQFTSRWRAWHSAGGGIRSLHWLSDVPEADHLHRDPAQGGPRGNHTPPRGMLGTSAWAGYDAAGKGATSWSSPLAVPGGPRRQGCESEDRTGGAVAACGGGAPGISAGGVGSARDQPQDAWAGDSCVRESQGGDGGLAAATPYAGGATGTVMSEPRHIVDNASSHSSSLSMGRSPSSGIALTSAVPLLPGPHPSTSRIATTLVGATGSSVVPTGSSAPHEQPPPAITTPCYSGTGEAVHAPGHEGARRGSRDGVCQAAGARVAGAPEVSGNVEGGTDATRPRSEAGSTSTDSSDCFVVVDLHAEEIDHGSR
eukprot:jgi/Mesvir1/22847/Mv20103-RA.2